MEYIVKWMPIAQLDLEDIYQFYLPKSERAANNIWNSLFLTISFQPYHSCNR